MLHLKPDQAIERVRNEKELAENVHAETMRQLELDPMKVTARHFVNAPKNTHFEPGISWSCWLFWYIIRLFLFMLGGGKTLRVLRDEYVSDLISFGSLWPTSIPEG